MGEVRLEIPARAAYLGLARQVVAAAAAVEPTFRDERIDACASRSPRPPPMPSRRMPTSSATSAS